MLKELIKKIFGNNTNEPQTMLCDKLEIGKQYYIKMKNTDVVWVWYIRFKTNKVISYHILFHKNDFVYQSHDKEIEYINKTYELIEPIL